ncbi:dienelactone hydrolase family protein [Parvibium lacunae]|uniref:Dienelactone hydrolase domain-containing protein n=1 Tax=Parvibium lacunae TaxID=1888893 RepID=A0A368L8A5_9BURK|nr:dienelactone hydrolase family protein [Parvibium lacunae]RCS59834.1 hypothetical protein DU000_03800 [Parvibium lacunae]
MHADHLDTTDSVTSLDTTRRQVLKSAGYVGVSGFALATLPVSASTIKTDSQGLQVGMADITTFDGQLPIYFARPATPKSAKEAIRFPVVLVVSEIFGVHEYIQDVCRRLAKQGYFAVAPNLFKRQGDPSQMTDNTTIIREVISKVPDEQVMKDLDACVKWVVSQGGYAERIGITGFCWGGRITWLYAAHNPTISAAVAWYGRLVGATSALTPTHPQDVAGRLHAPVLGLYGEKDSGIPLESVEGMRQKIDAAAEKGHPHAARSRIRVFADAPHAFHADYRPSYRAEAAQAGWAALTQWFKKYL